MPRSVRASCGFGQTDPSPACIHAGLPLPQRFPQHECLGRRASVDPCEVPEDDRLDHEPRVGEPPTGPARGVRQHAELSSDTSQVHEVMLLVPPAVAGQSGSGRAASWKTSSGASRRWIMRAGIVRSPIAFGNGVDDRFVAQARRWAPEMVGNRLQSRMIRDHPRSAAWLAW